MIADFTTPSKIHYHSVTENVNVVPEPIMYVQPENYKYIGDDDLATYVSDVVTHHYFKYKPLYMVNVVGNESRKQEVPFLNNGELKGYWEFSNCDKLDIFDLDSDSIGDKLDDEPKLMYLDTIFHGMPTLPSCLVNVDVNIPS